MSELNQLNEIEKLYAKPKTYSVPKKPKPEQEQIKIILMPLGLDELSVINLKKDSNMQEISANVKKLFSISLGITEEQAGKISFEFMEDLMEALMDANNFTEKDLKKSGINSFLNKKREQIEKNKVVANEPTGTTKE